MTHKQETAYLQAQYNRKRIYSRMRLGISRLFSSPGYLTVPALLIVLLFILWKHRWNIFPVNHVPEVLLPVFQIAISTAVIFIPLVFLLGFLELLGNGTARRDEAAIMMAFSEKDLRYGAPLLLRSKRIKGTRVAVKEFYSRIPLQTWMEKKDAISDNMNIHLVSPYMEYGGKRGDNGNYIRIYTAPGRKRPERGTLYDTEI